MWPRARLALMTGLAFSLGLAVGLLVHLPGVSSPGQGETESLHTHHHRSRRHSPTNPAEEQLRFVRVVNHTGQQRQQLSQKDPLSTLHSKIKQTYESIQALKTDRHHHQVLLKQEIVGQPAREPGQTRVGKSRPSAQSRRRNVSNVNNGKHRERAPHKGGEDDTPSHKEVSDKRPAKPKPLSEDQESLTQNLQDSVDIVEGVYWGRRVEQLLPEGYGEGEQTDWRGLVGKTRVVGLEEGCGRMQNRLVTLAGASKACARYRINVDQMQGEVYSYYLARLLGVRNLAPAVLAQPDPADSRWSAVAPEIIQAEWNPDRLVVLTPWVTHLADAYIPRELRKSEGALLPIPGRLGANRTMDDLTELAQWSDLVVFDYLTANVDRVVNNMFNQQWNDRMMDSPTHNLEKHSPTGLLVFLDNESGLFHSYRLLDKYAQYHNTLLKSLCVFRKSTAEAIKKLHKQNNVGEQLRTLFESEEPLSDRLPRMPSENARTLQGRVADVYRQITACEARFS